MEPKIQFIKGLDETVLPDVRLTRSRDGTTGTATFLFKNPNILNKKVVKEGQITFLFKNPNILNKKVVKEGQITGMYLIDKEGTLATREVNAKFINGKPQAVKSVFIMKSPEAWDRFIRFMERYGKAHGLIFTKAN